MADLASSLVRAGSIRTLEQAAAWRMQDAGALEAQGRLGGAVYLYGYVVEMRLCCATYRVLGYAPGPAIADVERRKHERVIRGLRSTSAARLGPVPGPHAPAQSVGAEA